MLSLLGAIGAPFIPPWSELKPFVADLWLIATIVAVLITPFFTRKSNVACGLVALAGLAAALLSLVIVGRNSENDNRVQHVFSVRRIRESANRKKHS